MSASAETETQEDDTLKYWGVRMCCYVCRKQGKRVRAVIRIFSGRGAYSGEGWPACKEHTMDAEVAALEPLNDPKIGPDWEVRAYAVEADEKGFPKMVRKLWIAKRRAS